MNKNQEVQMAAKAFKTKGIDNISSCAQPVSLSRFSLLHPEPSECNTPSHPTATAHTVQLVPDIC